MALLDSTVVVDIVVVAVVNVVVLPLLVVTPHKCFSEAPKGCSFVVFAVVLVVVVVNVVVVFVVIGHIIFSSCQ